ncbi:tRNA (adenine(22)-N(1))-methyltransferase [Lacticaseibacillus thailandensis]|uniref:SAM-dependent methyltransferase n=1 Tax=Lacticaseibacillus thailandensis DSM 22698 = JCM 13996 TaxID=1423810 RepID=A0A0R2C9T2_9LACO|nr:tRNA (adenine(22)-N(1))-methyltransferase TrmK [Lacticaseibacillus thailandensis]KRM88133.1 SAM-dependent methyltransferase [Lacticaseibacillus thailandensis DSM 22698 = JCM 13996]
MTNQTVHLSKRLAAIAAFVDSDARVADIGTDHALLPIALVQAHQANFVVASDIGAGPVGIARKNVAAHGLTAQQIDVRQADGLAGLSLNDGLDTIIIAGMGGELICKILTAGQTHLDGTETLILSPHRDENLVRQWLADHQCAILQEAILTDEGHTYEIIVAGQSQPAVQYDAADILCGPFLRRERNAAFVAKWTRRERKLKGIIASMAAAQQPVETQLAAARKELQIIQEVLA